ncbi:MAG TPA: hypothetical protein VF131_26635 [Blastocatellia bacterium]|nr:hypothetical protein [Blastocatellia bacterium]
MIRSFFVCLMILLVGSGMMLTGAAQGKKHGGFSISTGPEKTISDCSQIRITHRDAEVARAEQSYTLPRSTSPLQVQAPRNGGIHVQGWKGGEFSITACLSAAGDTSQEAQGFLAQISVSTSNGRVTVNGPTGATWVAYLIIQAPDGSALELESTNGPVGVSDFSGTVQARTQNGPITLHDVNGQVRADAQNGPINVTGNGGDFRLNAQNGPIGVYLTGNRWESGELEAHTQNGPLSLSVPPDYQSAVRVEASRHSPIECRAVQCKQAVRTWDRPSVIEFGGSSPVIRMSTVNGPVSVNSTGEK